MPSRRDALLPSMTFCMVYHDNCFFLLGSTCQIDLAMPCGRRNDIQILHTQKQRDERNRLTLLSATCKLTSDTGSHYCCGWVGRGIQPPSTPNNPTQHPFQHRHTHKKLQNACFSTFPLVLTDRRTDGPTNRRTNRLTDQPTDGQSLLQSCVYTIKNVTDRHTDRPTRQGVESLVRGYKHNRIR